MSNPSKEPEKEPAKVELVYNVSLTPTLKGHKCYQCSAIKDVKMCKTCKDAFFCSRTCQKLGWKQWHKYQCRDHIGVTETLQKHPEAGALFLTHSVYHHNVWQKHADQKKELDRQVFETMTAFCRGKPRFSYKAVADPYMKALCMTEARCAAHGLFALGHPRWRNEGEMRSQSEEHYLVDPFSKDCRLVFLAAGRTDPQFGFRPRRNFVSDKTVAEAFEKALGTVRPAVLLVDIDEADYVPPAPRKLGDDQREAARNQNEMWATSFVWVRTTKESTVVQAYDKVYTMEQWVAPGPLEFNKELFAEDAPGVDLVRSPPSRGTEGNVVEDATIVRLLDDLLAATNQEDLARAYAALTGVYLNIPFNDVRVKITVGPFSIGELATHIEQFTS